MRARRAAVVAAVALVTALAVAIPAQTAQAATIGTPPSALPGCEPGGERGGWALRDTIATGTSIADPAPVRPRALRFGEPCVVGGELTVPVTLTDLPVPMVDENADGDDDGPPSTEIVWTVCDAPPADPASRLANRARPMQPECNRVRGAFSTWRANVIINVTGTTVETNLVTSATGTGATVGLGRSCVTLTGTGASGTANLGTLSVASASLASVFTRTTTDDCAAGTHLVVFLYHGASYGSTIPVSILYGQSGAWDDGAADDVGAGYYGDTQAAQFVAPADDTYTGSGGSFIYCASAPATDPSITLEIGSPFGEPEGFQDEPPVVVDGEATAWTVTGELSLGAAAASCPYIVSIALTVCVYVEHSPSEYGCTEMLWLSERFNASTPYTGPEGGTPEESICRLIPSTPGCYEVLNPPKIDGTDFGTVCANPPALEGILDFTWLPDVIGHYAHCLFVPVNGWDADGRIADAADAVFIDDVFEGFWYIADLFWIDPGGCGPIFGPVTDGPMQGFEVNSCDVGNDFAPVRTALSWGVWITGGFFVVTFIWNNWIAFFFNVGKLPFAGKDDD